MEAPGGGGEPDRPRWRTRVHGDRSGRWCRVAVGGRGTLLGAWLVNYTESYFTVAAPEYWLFVLGGLFVLVTLFLPKGIVGTLAGLRLPHAARAADDQSQTTALRAGNA